MEPSELHNWSRHYDSTQWTVTTIFTAAVGGLLVYCNNPSNFEIVLALGGVALTLLTVFFAASFRSLRARLHAQLPKDDLPFLRSVPKFRQWPVHVGVFLCILALWLRLFLINHPEYRWLWVDGWALCALVTLYWGASADAAAKPGRRPDA